jgi:hypothetical protein
VEGEAPPLSQRKHLRIHARLTERRDRESGPPVLLWTQRKVASKAKASKAKANTSAKCIFALRITNRQRHGVCIKLFSVGVHY